MRKNSDALVEFDAELVNKFLSRTHEISSSFGADKVVASFNFVMLFFLLKRALCSTPSFIVCWLSSAIKKSEVKWRKKTSN